MLTQGKLQHNSIHGTCWEQSPPVGSQTGGETTHRGFILQRWRTVRSLSQLTVFSFVFFLNRRATEREPPLPALRFWSLIKSFSNTVSLEGACINHTPLISATFLHETGKYQNFSHSVVMWMLAEAGSVYSCVVFLTTKPLWPLLRTTVTCLKDLFWPTHLWHLFSLDTGTR